MAFSRHFSNILHRSFFDHIIYIRYTRKMELFEHTRTVSSSLRIHIMRREKEPSSFSPKNFPSSRIPQRASLVCRPTRLPKSPLSFSSSSLFSIWPKSKPLKDPFHHHGIERELHRQHQNKPMPDVKMARRAVEPSLRLLSVH